MLRLIFIRHGETDFNKERKYCGSSDPPLNKKGISQAEKLAAKLKNFNIEKAYSSSSRRTVETASAIFQASLIENTYELREMDFGAFEGLKYEELLQKHPQLYTEWINNPGEITPPGGERFAYFRKRVLDKFSYIIKLHNHGTIAVVSHGGPLRIILGDILNYDIKDFWKVEQDTGAFSIVEYTENSPPEIVRLNETPQPL